MDVQGLRISCPILMYMTLIFNRMVVFGTSPFNLPDAKHPHSPQRNWLNFSVQPLQEVHPQKRWLSQLSFAKSIYSFDVREDINPGSIVGQLEPKIQPHQSFVYSVLEDDGDGLFLLNPYLGEFLLSRALDFETEQFYILTAAMQQEDGQSASARVYFNVVDVNDNPPIFRLDAYESSLSEDSSVGSCFLALDVTDADEGENGEVDIEVETEEGKETFIVNHQGVLCLTRELDRERKAIYHLTIQAKDRALHPETRLTTTVPVTVQIEDINDSAPVITSSKTISCPEDIPLHSVVTVIQAVDSDVGPNGDIVYELDNLQGGTFWINSTTGVVHLWEPLDREFQDMLTVTLTARDKGSPQLSSSMNLTVLVEDANDQDPEFSQSFYSLDIYEDIPRGTCLLKMHAHDRDTGPNGQVRYQTSENWFMVDSVLGVVTVIGRFDRESKPFYSFEVIAVDQGEVQRSATAIINITVMDVNDCTPLFSPTPLTIHVLENAMDLLQTTQQISAVDEDLGMNSLLTYSIESGNEEDLFLLYPNGTFRILRRLDREIQDQYKLIVTAADMGLPSLTGTGTIGIIVDDLNDNSPVFTDKSLNTFVLEDIPVGNVFVTLSASDQDAGANGRIRYSLEETEAPFGINETSGEVFTTGLLDREATDLYSLTVVACDTHPTHPLSSTATVSVHVGDVNDHQPHFLYGPYVANVPAKMTAGSIVCAVIAADADEGMNARLHFSLHGRNADQFTISPLSGTVVAALDLTGTTDVTVTVHVEDGGDPPKMASTTLTVRYRTSSDFPRITLHVYRHLLPEDSPLGTLVATVTDETERNGPALFYLISGNTEDAFVLNQRTGEITVQGVLDFETIMEYHLLVEARDSGFPPFSSYTEVHLNVTDVNDNSPVFTLKEYRCEVFENAPGTVVCDVLAIDADSGIYGDIQYYILAGNTDDAFTLNLNTGSLKTTRSLDREKIPEYELTIEARDKDNENHMASATVLIAVLDKNDNAPRFTQIFYTQIPEDAPVGYTVLQITALDEDIGENAVIAYAIITQGGEISFSIDETNGIIIVTQPLDRENEDHYVVKVSANDSAWSISTDVTIIITDINDNRPFFSQSVYSVTVTETEAQVVFLLQVKAMDSDLDENAQILYFIKPENELFLLNISTGDVSTKQQVSLNESESKSFSFRVVASDCGLPPLDTSATINVTFVRFNYFPPSFLPFTSFLSLPFTLGVGTEVLLLLAADEDFPRKNDSIKYMVIGGNASNYFGIEANTGRVLLTRTLKHKLNTNLTLVVRAQDKGFPPLSSQKEINFEIIQDNLLAPYFAEHNLLFSVPEDLPLWSVIGKVEARDGDDGRNGLVSYSFEKRNKDGLFSIGYESGLISLTEKLDFEMHREHHINIVAKDGGWFSKTGNIDVTVNVIDVNDNPPVFSSKEYTIKVLENSPIGSTVFQLSATDEDFGRHAEIIYSVISGHREMFAVDSTSGTITTLEVFDFEQQQNFELIVKASNTGNQPLHDIAHVHIQISGVNEFFPEFQRHFYNFSVPETLSLKKEVGKVVADDLDLGFDGQVFYFLVGQSKRAGFHVDEESGILYTSVDLRNWDQDHAVVHVLAKNRGSITGFNFDETLVHIHVIHENDPPHFHSTLYTAAVLEDAVDGTSISRVDAVDQDVIWEWSHFSYSIFSGNDNVSFAIDPFSGIISVNNQLDRERWPFYNLTIIAVDGGSPPVTGSTNVVVTIIDINDNAPMLVSTSGYVRENRPHGTIVATLTATDDDLPPNEGPFTFWLLRSAAGSSFSLTSDGILSTSKSLDREQNPLFHLRVVVQDAGTPPLSSTVSYNVEVQDENDNPSAQRTVYIEVKYYGSSFPGGFIGNVSPEDPDESDVFSCSIKNGPQGMFGFPFGMCNLWSSAYQGEASYNVTIEASDQFHPAVNNSIYVSYKGFTNSSVDNCVLFYVTSSTLEKFLSLKYLKFVKALDSLFNLRASKTHVFGIKVHGDQILLLAAVKSYNGQYLGGEVASSISGLHKKVLEAQSNVTISQITNDPCFLNQCQNGAVCRKNIHISQDVVVAESLSLIFVSPEFIEVFNCTCTAGFTGTLCETDIDECHSNPCENEGTCFNTVGGFYCNCTEGFSGQSCTALDDECQTVVCQNGGSCWNMLGGFLCDCSLGYEGTFCEVAVDHCASSPCLQGNCSSFLTGFTCHCPFGVSGVNCQESVYGFEELSYMEFPPLDPRNNLISLDFATVQQNSLLLFNSGGQSSSEFLALDIVNRRLGLSYDLGFGVVRLEAEKHVADGNFHTVNIHRTGNMASIEVDSCSADEPKGFCFSQVGGTGPLRTLDVSLSNMTLGGVKSTDVILQLPSQFRSHDFVGCMRNIKVNNIALDTSKALKTHKVLERCPRADFSPCNSQMCLNGGICQDHWSFHYCQCKDHFTGSNCATEISEEHAFLFDGNSYVEFFIKENYKRDQLLQTLFDGQRVHTQKFLSIEVKIRTTRKDSTLIHCLGKTASLELRISDGNPVYLFNNLTSWQQSELTVGRTVADGQWHVLHLRKDGKNTVVLIDKDPVVNTTNPTTDSTALNTDVIVLGAARPGDLQDQHAGFMGCIEYIRFNDQTLSFSGFSKVVAVEPSPSLVQNNCVSPDNCVLMPCIKEDSEVQNHRCSTSSTENSYCICLHNVTATACESCSPLTENRGSCLEAHKSAPMWIVGIVLPLTAILIALFLCITLKRQAKKTQSISREQAYCVPQTRPQGTDNVAFSLDSVNAGPRDSPEESGRQLGLMVRDTPGGSSCAVECHTEAELPCQLTGAFGSELEYYEIESTYTTFPSDSESLQLGLHSPDLTGETSKSVEQGLRGQHLLTPVSPSKKKQDKQQPSESSAPQYGNRGRISAQAYGGDQDGDSKVHVHSKKTLIPDLIEPPQYLSVDELRRLNSPLEKNGSLYPGQPIRTNSTAKAADSSSESDSHSSFTCSEYEYEREPSITTAQGGRHVQTVSAEDLSKEGQTPNTQPPLSESVPYASVTENVQAWESLLNLGLHFNSYAEVFEDIASLQHDCDLQSELEEII